jgi:alpha-tubulin suppressor-like RCC1 family protein
VRVLTNSTFTKLIANGNHTCGLTAAGAAWCWGANTTGQVGDGSNDNRYVPVAVSGGFVFRALALGAAHTCGVTSTGTVRCWGQNTGGQLGDGSVISRNVPTLIAGSITF